MKNKSLTVKQFCAGRLEHFPNKKNQNYNIENENIWPWHNSVAADSDTS